MSRHSRLAIWLVVVLLVSGLWVASASAGMPAPLPTDWTAENTPGWAYGGGSASSGAMGLRVQAISFFLAVLLLSGWLVKGLWNFARRDFPKLPALTYGRALGAGWFVGPIVCDRADDDLGCARTDDSRRVAQAGLDLQAGQHLAA